MRGTAGGSRAATAETDGTTDAQLVVAAQADRRAFGALYARYVDAVYRYCYYRLGNREAAEDAISSVFTRALAALPRYRNESFRPWLFTIAHNVVIDAVRRSRPARPLADARDVWAKGGDPEEMVVAELETDGLQALLDRLPADQRQVMELPLSGLTSPEVGRVLGRSPAAIRSLQFRAVQRLRAQLAPDGELGVDDGATN